MPNDPAWFAQEGFRVRLEWGRRGARAAAERGDALVVVDVLSFSTAVAAATARGAIVYPCARGEDTPEFAAQVGGAEIAVHREAVPERGRFSLSPGTLRAATPGTRIVIASPNGATCSRYGADVPVLLAGALVNARAVAETVAEWLRDSPGSAVTVLACGERWDIPDADDGDLRFALEDYLGAGAVIAHLPDSLSRSPEASISAAAFRAAEMDIAAVLRACGSGIELIGKGFAGDVEEAAAVNTLAVVPRLLDRAFGAKIRTVPDT